MADYQRTVEYLRDIRASLGAGNTLVTDELRQAAAAYADLCAQANERLRKCSGFLAQGLRSEAVNLADESPNLLDLVAALDLPDPGQWAEFCQMNDLPVPEALQMDRAQQLNEAYAADQPLEALLNQHRYLALARAPVSSRLSVLRQIATADPANENWEKDVRIFEKARLKELPAAFYVAVKNKDASAIAALQTEVNESPWYEDPPADLRTALGDAWKRTRRAQADADLRPLVEPLREAFAARDYDACLSIVNRWKAIMESAEITTCAPDLAHEVAPVVEWLRAEDDLAARRKRYANAQTALVQLLDSNASDHDLEAAYERLKTFDEPVPAELTERYHARLADRERAAKRSMVVRLISIAAAILVVAGITFTAVWFLRQGNTARTWANAISSAVTARDIEAARKLVKEQESLAPGVSTADEVRAAKAAFLDLEARHAEALSRVETVAGVLAAAKTQAEPVVADDAASPDALLTAARAVSNALNESSGGDLEWVDRENRISTARKEIADLQARLLQRANAIVKSEADKLSTEIAGLALPASTDTAATTTLMSRLNELNDRLARLRAITGIDNEARTALDTVSTRLAEKLKDAEASNKLAAALENVRREAVIAERLKAALERFIAAFPDHPITPDFKQSLAAIPAAKSAEAYARLAASWQSSGSGAMARYFPSSAAAAQKRLDEITAYVNANPASPFAATLNYYAEYLRHMTEALSDKDPWTAGYGGLLASPLLSDMSYLETSAGQRYFLLSDPKVTNRGINNQRSISFHVLNPKDPSKTVMVEINSPVTLLNDGKPRLTAHARFVQDLTTEMKRIDENNWETFGIETIDKLLANNEIDIVVKSILVSLTIQAQNGAIGPIVADLYEKPLRELKRLEPEKMVWYDNASPLSDTNRKALKATLDAVPRGDVVRKALAARKLAMTEALSFAPNGTGILMRDESGNYQIVANAGSLAGNAAYAVVPDAAATPAKPAAPAAPATPAESDNPGGTPAPATPPEATALFNVGPSARLVKVATFATDKWQPVGSAPQDIPQGTMLFMAK